MTDYTSAPLSSGSALHIYLAAPMGTYYTPRYEWALSQVRTHFPDHELISAREQYSSNADWCARWPAMCSTLSALVFIADPEGWIGLGVWCEIHYAKKMDLPVWYLCDQGLLPFHEIGF